MKNPCKFSVSGLSPGFWTHSSVVVMTALVLALAGLGAGAPAAPPGNADMVRLGRESVARSLADALTRATTPQSTMAMVKRLSEERRTAHRVIGAEFPLTDFKGIVLSDTYDQSYIAAIDSLSDAYLRTDDSLPSAEAGAVMSRGLSDLPPIPDTPAPFVAAFVIMRCTQASLQIPSDVPAAVRAEIPEVALRMIHEVTQRYLGSRGTFEGRMHADEVWQASVLERIRCPTHAAPYTLGEERNGLRGDGTFYRRYVVTCSQGGETRHLDFNLEALSAITRSGGRQEMPARLETPSSRQPGVDQ